MAEIYQTSPSRRSYAKSTVPAHCESFPDDLRRKLYPRQGPMTDIPLLEREHAQHKTQKEFRD